MRGRLGFPACDLVKVRIDHVSYWFVCDLTFELVDLDLGVIFPHAGCKLSDQHHNNRVPHWPNKPSGPARLAVFMVGVSTGVEPTFMNCVHLSLVLCLEFAAIPGGAAQQNIPKAENSGAPPQQEESSQSRKLSRLPIEWIIGPYVPVQEQLKPLTNSQREQAYFRQTFLTAGSYVARAFSAGLDQARGVPQQWGGGWPGYGRRYSARYGEFVVQNTWVAAGNALLDYEPRYDFCRCDGFWPRTLHAISRNFVAYNRTERELRPQTPTYTGAFASGLLYNTWLPGQNNIWKGGALSMLSQAGIGSGYNFVSEFSLDILHAFGLKKEIHRKGTSDRSPPKISQ
jgi:hypothetical protein